MKAFAHLPVAVAFVGFTMPIVVAAPPCDPDDHYPAAQPTPGCEWKYWDASITDVTEITSRSDTLKHTAWESLPFCACGWYPHTVPCPTCPATTTEVSISDTLQWTVTTTSETEWALELKAELIVEVGFSGTLTTTEQLALSGTHTETTTTTLSRQPIMCFTRYYRQQWTEHKRTGSRKRTWKYYWMDWCVEPDPAIATTGCTEVLAQGTVTWNTYPNYQWAPQQPPCGGVAIQTPDPWNGKREEPCCSDVCNPPPSPQHPCCGCGTQN